MLGLEMTDDGLNGGPAAEFAMVRDGEARCVYTALQEAGKGTRWQVGEVWICAARTGLHRAALIPDSALRSRPR